MTPDAQIFETHRPALLSLAYRMLGDMARAGGYPQPLCMDSQRPDRNTPVAITREGSSFPVARLTALQCAARRAIAHGRLQKATVGRHGFHGDS